MLLLLLVFCACASAKLYDRCDLARELKHIHQIPMHQIATWVCIAKHESSYNTSAINHGSGDHGLFQISQIYWCSPPGNGKACNVACSQFHDDNIADDLICVRRIYNEHKKLSGDGFNAWVVYPLYCKGDVRQYVEGCFDGSVYEESTNTTQLPFDEDDDDDGYDFPPLPTTTRKPITNLIQSRFQLEPKTKHHHHQNQNPLLNLIFPQTQTSQRPILNLLVSQISQLNPIQLPNLPSIPSFLNPFSRQLPTVRPLTTTGLRPKPPGIRPSRPTRRPAFQRPPQGAVAPISGPILPLPSFYPTVKPSTVTPFPTAKPLPTFAINNNNKKPSVLETEHYTVLRKAGGFSILRKN